MTPSSRRGFDPADDHLRRLMAELYPDPADAAARMAELDARASFDDSPSRELFSRTVAADRGERGFDPDVGIITTLPVEMAAVRSVFEISRDVEPGGYLHGALPSTDRGPGHNVVVHHAAGSGKSATIALVNMLQKFEGIRCVILVGIASGVPRADAVNLGDVVVATEGIVSYDGRVAGRETPSRRAGAARPLAALLQADRRIQLMESAESSPWARWRMHTPEAARYFSQFADHGPALQHPRPRVHRGQIASSDRIPQDCQLLGGPLPPRVCAVEMEGHATISAAALEGLPTLIVRGVADLFGSASKSSAQPYAAWTAAAYARALLEECPPFTPTTPGDRGEVVAPSRRQLDNIVDAIMESRIGRDQIQQRSFLNLVQPGREIDRRVVDARQRLSSALFDCAHQRWGRAAVIGALEEITLGRGEAVRAIAATIQENWPVPT